MHIIALMGPATGGKSSLCKEIRNRLENSEEIEGQRILYRPIATFLKCEAAEHFGWDGTKSPKQRAILQSTSEHYKKLYGEDIFIRKCLEYAYEAEADIVLMDDLRHAVEIAFLGSSQTRETIVNIAEPIAEELWESAFSQCRHPDDEFGWAIHRSELEWRGFRHLYPQVLNDKSRPDGLNVAVNRIVQLAGLLQ